MKKPNYKKDPPSVKILVGLECGRAALGGLQHITAWAPCRDGADGERNSWTAGKGYVQVDIVLIIVTENLCVRIQIQNFVEPLPF